MLLRASRAAGQLTKEAIVGRLAYKGGKAGLEAIGRNATPILGTGFVASMAAPELAHSARKSNVGLSQPWLQAANARQVPSIPQF